jgi:hypothetical protein
MPEKNEFFDIKPLKDWSILWFPISMSNISTKQKVTECMKWIDYFGDKKAGEPKLGLDIVYCDFLYLNSNLPSRKLKEKFMFQMVNHKGGLKKAIHRNRKNLQIQQAFHFETWGNLYLQVKGDFNEYFLRIKKLYARDKLFRKYVHEDARHYKRKLNKNELNFFLEEHLMAYLSLNKMVAFRNEYVQGREKNVLMCYPGVPPKAQIYLLQKNPFKFLTNNPFIGQYNLSNKKFYDAKNIDLRTWNYE